MFSAPFLRSFRRVMILEVVSLIVIISLIWFLKTCYERRGMPPGPFPLPLIGNLHLILHDDMPFSAEKFREKYGDIFTIALPTENIVMINDTATAREALLTQKDIFHGRIPDVVYPLNEILEGKDVMAIDLNPEYRLRRKAMNMALHIFGEGKKAANENINDQLDEFFMAIEKLDGQPFYPPEILERSIASHLWRWVTNKTDNISDGTADKLLDFNRTFFGLVYSGPLYRLVPILKYFPTKHVLTVEYVKRRLHELFVTETIEHEKTYQEGKNRDIMDSLLAFCIKLGLKTDCVSFLSADIILAGADTTGTFLVWFLLYMILNQDLQRKLQAEVDAVLQDDEILQWNDFNKLPYLQATACEIMRHSYFVPLSLPHNPMQETHLQGFRIPKGTTVFFNYHCIHRDERVWQNPSEFNPDRFLDESGKFVGWRVKPGFMPFGIGTRSCPGEVLSRAQILIFTSGMLKRYTFEVNKDEPLPTLERGAAAGKFQPKPYKAIAGKRK